MSGNNLHFSKINIIYYNVVYVHLKQHFVLTTDSIYRPDTCLAPAKQVTK